MKAFIASCVAVVVIAVVAAFALDTYDRSSATVYSTGNVRLSPAGEAGEE